MKRSFPAVAFLLALTIFMGTWVARAETEPQSLTLLYSNNINGEIEPCPT